MKHFDIQKSFHTAKKAPINSEWQALGRAKLSRYVEMQPIKGLSGIAESPRMTLHLLLNFKPMFAIILIAAIVLGGGGTVAASQNDLPGDALYTIKIATENFEQALIFSPSEKAEIKAKNALKRTVELADLTKRDGTPSTEAVAEATARYKALLKEINDITSGLSPEQKLKVTPRILALIAVSIPDLQQVRSSTATSTRDSIDETVAFALETELDLSEKEKDAAEQEPSLTGLKHRAENKINEVTRKVADIKANFLTTSTSTSSSAKIASAEAILADAQAKFATGTYAEAFLLAKDAEKAAIEAKQALHRTKHDDDTRNEKGEVKNEKKENIEVDEVDEKDEDENADDDKDEKSEEKNENDDRGNDGRDSGR